MIGYRFRVKVPGFLFAGFSDMRGKLFPDLKEAFSSVIDSQNTDQLESFVEKGKEFRRDIAQKAPALYYRERSVLNRQPTAEWPSVSTASPGYQLVGR